MFYDTLSSLCATRHTNVTSLLITLGLSTSKVTLWKNGSIPKGDTIVKIANYFNVTTDYLLGVSDTPERQIEDNPFMISTSKLNDIGKQKALEYIKDLAENPRYRISVQDDVKIVAQKKPEKTPKADDKPRLI